MTEESFKRKLIAMLSADVEGYSRLMGEDEDATIRTLTAYRELMSTLIQKHRGRVVDSPGDNLLAGFGSVVDGVRCAVEIQEELRVRNAELPENRRMQFRIGVNLGDVVEEGERIYGDGVNITARVEGLAEGGGICISGTVYDSIKNKLSLSYESLGEHTVKNITEPVRVYRMRIGPEAAEPLVQDERVGPRRWRWAALTAVVAIVVVAGGLAIWNFYFRHPSVEPASVNRMAYPLPDKPSIAVLHFVNMSDDVGQEHFADGLTEDIITDLSKVSGLLVISRTSTLKYKGKPVAVRQVAEDLGVRYVLEGSVRRSGDRLRITAQLIDGTSGNHVWAERYDRDIKEVFAVQDDVARNVVAKMAVRLGEGEEDRMIRRHTNNVEANELYHRGVGTMVPPRPKTLPIARKMFEKAIELDPKFAGGHAGLSWIHSFTVQLGLSKSPRHDIAEAFRLAQKSILLDDTMGEPHTALANAYLLMGEHDKAVTASERAVQVEPGYSAAHMLHGRALKLAGRAAEGIKPIKRAIRMSPENAEYSFQLGTVYRAAGQFDKAIEAIEGAIARGGRIIPLFLANLAAAQTQSGREAEARATVAKLLKMAPGYSVELLRKTAPFKRREDWERLEDALRKAGLK